MMNTVPANTLKRLRLEAGFVSARQAAQAMGAKPSTYTQHESGTRSFAADVGFDYGTFFLAVRAMNFREANNLTPLTRDHLAAKVHAIAFTAQPDRPRWADMSGDDRAPYYKAADAARTYAGVDA